MCLLLVCSMVACKPEEKVEPTIIGCWSYKLSTGETMNWYFFTDLSGERDYINKKKKLVSVPFTYEFENTQLTIKNKQGKSKTFIADLQIDTLTLVEEKNKKKVRKFTKTKELPTLDDGSDVSSADTSK